jgi:hypothetical protein
MSVAALWAVIVHLPLHGLQGPDDPFYLTVARLWLSGQPPYVHAFDVKPPGAFALLTLAGGLFGLSQATLEGLTTASDAVAAFCLWRIGRSLDAPSAGAFAAPAYPLLSVMLAANPGYPPLAAATIAAFAFALASFDWRCRVALAGLFIGFAMTIKQTAALEALALLWLLMREPEAQGRRLRSALGFAAAAAAAPLAFALLLAVEGGLAPFFADVVVVALGRPGIDGRMPTMGWVRFFSVQGKIWPLATFAAIAAVRCRALPPSERPGRAEGLALWLAASWIELFVQHARWLNYLGPTFAPALLLSGLAVARMFRQEALRLATFLALAVAIVGAAYPCRIWAFLAPDDDRVIEAAAAAIRAQDAGPRDRLLAIGSGMQLNVATGLAPPTPFFHWMHILCDFPGAGPPRLREALWARPRFIVAATHRSRPACLDPSAWPLIETTLAQDYRRIAQAPAGAPKLDIYMRRD